MPYNQQKGFSLLELVLAIAIFAIGSIVSGNLLIDANTATRIDIDKADAAGIGRECIEAVTSMRDNGFDALATATQSPTTHGLANPTGYTWTFSGSSDTVNSKFTRTVAVTSNPVSMPAGGFAATSTITVVCTTSWENARGAQDSVVLTTLLTNWRLQRVD